MKKKVVFGLPALFAALALALVGCSNYEHPSYTTAKAVGVNGSFSGAAIDTTAVTVSVGAHAFDGTEALDSDGNIVSVADGTAASNAFLMTALGGTGPVTLYFEATVGADNSSLYVQTSDADATKISILTDTMTDSDGNPAKDSKGNPIPAKRVYMTKAQLKACKWYDGHTVKTYDYSSGKKVTTIHTLNYDLDVMGLNFVKVALDGDNKPVLDTDGQKTATINVDGIWNARVTSIIPDKMTYAWKNGKLQLSSTSAPLSLVSPMTLSKE